MSNLEKLIGKKTWKLFKDCPTSSLDRQDDTFDAADIYPTWEKESEDDAVISCKCSTESLYEHSFTCTYFAVFTHEDYNDFICVLLYSILYIKL